MVARSSKSSTTHALSAANDSGGRKNALQHMGRILCDAVGNYVPFFCALRPVRGITPRASWQPQVWAQPCERAMRLWQRQQIAAARSVSCEAQSCRGAASEIHHGALAAGAIPQSPLWQHDELAAQPV